MGLLLQSGEIHHGKLQYQSSVSSGHKHIKELFLNSGMFLTPLYANADGFHHTLFKVFTYLCRELLQTIYQSLSEVPNCFGALQHDRTNYREDLICIMVQHSQLHIAEIRK